MSNILDQIRGPEDLKNLTVEQLESLAEEIRAFITQSVSQTGGHLASNLGVVDVTIAMHRVFDFRKDKLLWDVGHQCYAHKILTGRREAFTGLRQLDGLSGFPSPQESPYDQFFVGHAGTSIATAIGMALGADHAGTDEKVVAFVGDASIVNGLSFEALNNLSLVKRQMLIVLNDNSMAIDITPGAMASFLSRVRLSHTYEDIRKTTRSILEHLPLIGRPMEGALENFKKTLRMQISPSRLFESLNIPYFGPVDGHDISSLIELFEAVGNLDQPAILHVYTRKGKGFTPADNNPTKFHSTGPFVINGDDASVKKGARSYTTAFGDALMEAAETNDKILAITAAMPDGTGLVKFRKKFPDRFYDVGIAESVAVDIAAGLAKQGFRPFVCIYSTFLQRGIDQVFQEVALQNLPVVFCIDRAGLVGNDGPTHHGTMDIGFLRMLPNLVLVSPVCESEMQHAVAFAAAADYPVAIRYPRDVIPNGRIEEICSLHPFALGQSLTIRQGGDTVVLVALGSLVSVAFDAAEMLAEQGVEATVINARFAKPVDQRILKLWQQGSTIITMEDHTLACGFGSAVQEAAGQFHLVSASDESAGPGRILNLAIGDSFLRAGPRKWQLDSVGLSPKRIFEMVCLLLSIERKQCASEQIS
ncbi:MAG: 1-deoxy-D-xylulose-5-phosphate synthase [Sedimentisphaerales bacterium]|nr:1-deoxy-D-xylulose-5-phosphate synthase [Sedimentisphaerales bacterium]